MKKYYLAIDLGASSGRHIIGYYENDELITQEVYRFTNGVTKLDGHLTWDIDGLFNNVVNGISEAFKLFPNIESISIDSWGVDYALIENDKIKYPVYAYRDSRTEKPIQEVHNLISKRELFNKTGIAFQTYNTVYQLYADKLAGRLEGVTDFLMIPEVLNYLLTGVKKKEYTNATTGALVNATTKEFDKDIISTLGLPSHLFQKLYEGGDVVGSLKPEIQQIVGGNSTVKLCLSHDTASAFYIGGKLGGDNSAIMSSGTWSLLGTKETVLHNGDMAFDCGFTNEGGIDKTYRFLKNIMGMWVINNVSKELNISPADLAKIATESNYDYTIDVNDNDFFAPESMTQTIKAHLAKSGAPELKDDKDMARCAIASLARSYSENVKFLEQIVGRKLDNIVIVGGGAKNKLLNELTEKYSGKKVIAKPIEATAIGNLEIQMS